jgi:NAD(P)-dependent dehydrogenase (short-subunit alcohol dehydrogenase family)
LVALEHHRESSRHDFPYAETTVIDFSGQSAIVTGSGRGLGRLYALDLARRGAQVVVNDIGSSMTGVGTDRSVADQVVEEIRAAGGTAVASHDPVDTPEGGAAIVQTALDAFGRVDVVVSNAGIYEMVPFDELTVDQWRRMLEIHLDGAFYLAQPAFRAMKSQGYGRFVMISSQMGAFGQELNSHYGAAKGGVLGLTGALANEGAAHGILANSVLPVGRTRMMTDSIQERDANEVTDRLFAETTAERVVPLVVYLASRDCTVNKHFYSAAAGRFARVFVGLGEGWLADRDAAIAAEDIAEHLEDISSTEGFTIPASSTDEIIGLLQRLEII